MEYFITVTEKVDGRLYTYDSHYNSEKRAKEFIMKFIDKPCKMKVRVE